MLYNEKFGNNFAVLKLMDHFQMQHELWHLFKRSLKFFLTWLRLG